MVDTYSVKKELSILNAKWLLETISGSNSSNHLYTFIGKSSPWTVETEPPMPTDCPNNFIQTWKDIIAIKNVQPTDITLAIRKNVWNAGTVYDMYDDTDPNLYEKDYFVINSENKVYKCLDNNNNSPSTQEPTSISLTPFTEIDGYKWQLMYDITSDEMTKWSDDIVIPVKEINSNDNSLQWQVQSSTVPGTIDYIKVNDGGSGYLVAPQVTITGDGTGATATAVLSGDTIERIVINNRGKNYTYANVMVTGNANLQAIISPIKGHGSNAVDELNGRYIIVRTVFDKDEGGTLPVDISFRQIGLLMNPTLYGTTDKTTLSSSISQMAKIELSAEPVNFILNEQIINQNNNSTAIYSSHNDKNMSLTSINGIFNIGDNITGVSSGQTATITNITNPYLNLYSGSLLYVENREPVQRLEHQTETYRLVIAF